MERKDLIRFYDSASSEADNAVIPAEELRAGSNPGAAGVAGEVAGAE